MDKSAQIKIIKAKIAQLEVEKKHLAEQLSEIEEESVSSQVKLAAIPSCNSSLSGKSFIVSDDKIKLFRSLFHGRDDVYARFWTSRKTGKSGYSPACKNEWVKGICVKPASKCSDCSNRALIPLTDDIISRHLQGEYVIGIFPMLKGDTCYFLTTDFDGEGWQEDITAYRKICSQHGIPVAIERSRSGKGAHAWIFFSENIPAARARKMGSFLITESMAKRYQIDMKSYDRLFPNQDTLPKGGFGNLIALPFQKNAILQGNTVFIDDDFNPYSDQWGFLSGLRKMTITDTERISDKTPENNRIIGTGISPVRENEPPWIRLASGKRRQKPVIDNLPENIEIVTADKLYIAIKDLPSALITQIKRLAAFQNPEFYRRQSMRLSTVLTPRIISCSEISDVYITLPRGCLDDLCCLLKEYGVKISLRDKTYQGERSDFRFQGSLSEEQKISAQKILENKIGVLVAPSGIGKTVIGIYVIAQRKTNTLILVHRKSLLDQWRMQLSSFLGMGLKDIGEIGGGKNKPNGILDVAMIQSMERKGVINNIIENYGFIVVDECHHIPAFTFERILSHAKAKYVLGLTATPYRRDGHQPIILMQCGPICHRITEKRDVFNCTMIPRVTEFTFESSESEHISKIWSRLIADERRNKLITDDIIKTAQAGRHPIVITERREHLKILADRLNEMAGDLVILYGGLGRKQQKETMEKLRNCSKDSKKIILATGSYIGEGFDEIQLDTLFVTMPISFKGKVVQYAGRLHRECQGKQDIQVYDYADVKVPLLLKMYLKRLKAYKSMGYKILEEASVQKG